jgi:hypothetical protein
MEGKGHSTGLFSLDISICVTSSTCFCSDGLPEQTLGIKFEGTDQVTRYIFPALLPREKSRKLCTDYEDYFLLKFQGPVASIFKVRGRCKHQFLPEKLGPFSQSAPRHISED